MARVLIRGDSLLIGATVSGITDPATVSRIGVVTDSGEAKYVPSPSAMANMVFEWTPTETAVFPLRRILVRLVVELVDGRRFTVSESSFVVVREFKERS
jgi:hypothetical protein